MNIMTTIIETESQLYETLGLRLRKARIQKNETQHLFGIRVGVSRQVIGRMERGDPAVSLEKWIAVSAVLGLLDSWKDVLLSPIDPFEEYDRQLDQDDRLRKKRVRSPSG